MYKHKFRFLLAILINCTVNPKTKAHVSFCANSAVIVSQLSSVAHFPPRFPIVFRSKSLGLNSRDTFSKYINVLLIPTCNAFYAVLLIFDHFTVNPITGAHVSSYCTGSLFTVAHFRSLCSVLNKFKFAFNRYILKMYLHDFRFRTSMPSISFSFLAMPEDLFRLFLTISQWVSLNTSMLARVSFRESITSVFFAFHWSFSRRNQLLYRIPRKAGPSYSCEKAEICLLIAWTCFQCSHAAQNDVTWFLPC